MEKSKIISGVIVLAVIAVGVYLITSRTENSSENTDTTTTDTTNKKMPFSEFVKAGGSYKCEVKQYMSDMENSGTVYISGGNISGKYTTVAEGMTVESSFVMKDGYSYTWSDMMPGIGFKVKVNTTINPDGTTSTSDTYSWNAEQIGDYNCEPWTFDASMFALPANISFTEVGDK